MKLLLLVCTAFLVGPGVWAQSSQSVIHGKVTAGGSEKGIGNVSIYIANTTVGTFTNERGEFTLTRIPEGKYSLVFSSVGYETYVEQIDTRALKSAYAVVLQAKPAELSEVTIVAGKAETWKKWGAFFSNTFIGASALARQCKLMNKEVVKFYYSKKYNRLTASARVPLIFENKSLGYDVRVNLERFRYDFNTNEVEFAVFPLFIEREGSARERKKWVANRQEAYYGSSIHFFRALCAGNWKEQGFSAHIVSRPDSTMIKMVKNALRNHMVPVVDSAGKVVGYKPDEAQSFTKETMAQYEELLARSNSQNVAKLEYPMEASFDELASAGQDSSSVLLDFDLQVRITYWKKALPKEYYEDRAIDASNPSSGRMVPVVRRTNEGMTTMLELTEGLPVEVFSNGSFMNSDLMFTGWWGWWQKMSTMLPFNYEP